MAKSSQGETSHQVKFEENVRQLECFRKMELLADGSKGSEDEFTGHCG